MMTKTRVFIYIILITVVISVIIHSYWQALGTTSLSRYSPEIPAVRHQTPLDSNENDTDALLTVAELLNYVSKPASGNEKATDQTSRFGHPQNGGQNQDHNRDGLHREVGLHPTKVCVVATNKRQGSIFRTNLLGIFGTGKYTYAVKGPGKCPWGVPRIRMIPYVKCCMTTKSVRRKISQSIKVYDVIIITGDEYCKLDDPRAHFRQYHGDQMMGKGSELSVTGIQHGVKFPLYIPLGPRSEFERVAVSTLMPVTERKYLFNFVGSLTSTSRRKLKAILMNNPYLKGLEDQDKSFIHITDRWRTEITVKGGFISPKDYRKVLLNSKFTLCPIGHNPEAYRIEIIRIYEACEAGTIPILTTHSPVYLGHKCKNSYAPLINEKAPFVWLNDWSGLAEIIKRSENETWVHEKQLQVVKWYRRYMRDFSSKFEKIMDWRFRKRIGRERPSQTEEAAITKDELREAMEISQNLSHVH